VFLRNLIFHCSSENTRKMYWTYTHALPVLQMGYVVEKIIMHLHFYLPFYTVFKRDRDVK